MTLRWALLTPLLILGGTPAAHANAITDWDEKATTVASSPGAVGQRELAIVDIAMFDAVNSIECRYRPYLVQLNAGEHASGEAVRTAGRALTL